MTDTRVAVLVGSLRADSLNRKLAEVLRDQAPEGVTLEIVDGLGELPFYNEDLDGDRRPRRRRGAARAGRAAPTACSRSRPEYNGTMPAVLNNAIDWLSRPYGAGRARRQAVRRRRRHPDAVRRQVGARRHRPLGRHRRCGRRRGRHRLAVGLEVDVLTDPEVLGQLHDGRGPARRLRARRPRPPDGCRRGLTGTRPRVGSWPNSMT